MKSFFQTKIIEAEKLLSKKPENFWQKKGEQMALDLFYKAAREVPAYKDFLKKNKVNADKVKTIKDFSHLPTTDKQNYIQKYTLASRSFGGNLNTAKIIASSSGTKGTPNYWPRTHIQEEEARFTHELLFRNLYQIHKVSTLVVIGFPMGVYVSGLATTLPIWSLSHNYNLSIVSAGNNKLEFLKAVKNLANNFEQMIFIGHPFFLKDVLETGTAEGMNWKKYKINLMFCSEGFSEVWRDHVLAEAGGQKQVAFNTYGSSEMLLMAYETPDSINIKKQLEDSALESELLGTSELFNFFQYNPTLRYIEEKNSELLFTSLSGQPLIRFNLHDKGKIVSHREVKKALPSQKNPHWNLPYLALFGRSDYAVVFYAANIYPQHIHKALNQKFFLKHLTGKFCLSKGYLKNLDEYLEIHIELKYKSQNHNLLARKLKDEVVKHLKTVNAEYKFLTENLQKDLIPRVKLWPYGHERYFKPGLKPRYIQ